MTLARAVRIKGMGSVVVWVHELHDGRFLIERRSCPLWQWSIAESYEIALKRFKALLQRKVVPGV